MAKIAKQTIDNGLDTMNHYKKVTKGNQYFGKKTFTEFSLNEDNYCQIKRDFYELTKLEAIEIAKKYNIFSNPKDITDDDTIHDWLTGYNNNLGALQEDYGMDMFDIQTIFTWNSLCQQRAFSPCATDFTLTQIFMY